MIDDKTKQVLNSLPHNPRKPFENIVGKGENTGNQHFLIFSTMFSTLSKREIGILATLNLSSANAFNLVRAIFFSFGKDLRILSDYGLTVHPYVTEILFEKHSLTLSQTNRGLRAISPFPTVFSNCLGTFLPFICQI